MGNATAVQLSSYIALKAITTVGRVAPGCPASSDSYIALQFNCRISCLAASVPRRHYNSMDFAFPFITNRQHSVQNNSCFSRY